MGVAWPLPPHHDCASSLGEKVTKKIKSLRSQYTREKQKERRKRSLAGVDGGYLSKWMHYDSLNFLEEFVIPRQSSTGHGHKVSVL